MRLILGISACVRPPSERFSVELPSRYITERGITCSAQDPGIGHVHMEVSEFVVSGVVEAYASCLVKTVRKQAHYQEPCFDRDHDGSNEKA